MKKRIFSPRLYWDGIKQLRIIGILATVAITFIGIVSPLMYFLSTLDYPLDEQTPSTINYLEMNLLVPVLFCVIAPLMTLYLFSFLNKRDSSDFYHAIPETRECIFLSFIASIVTWLLFITLVSGIAITGAYAALPQFYTVNMTSVFLTGFNMFSGSLLIMASVAIAMCVTGTVFSNVLVSLLLIFFPRALIQTALTAVTEALPLVSDLPFASFLSYEYNVPVGFIFGYLFGDYEKSLTTLSSGIYTLVVAVLFVGLATVLFKKRNSEAAGQSAPNKALQATYRFLIGSTVASAVAYCIFDTFARGDSLDISMIGTLVLLFIVSVLVALAFQVITTHTFKKLPRYALSTALAMLLFIGVYVGGMYGLYYTTFSFSPSADEIQSVRILSDDRSNRHKEYFSEKIQDLELTDASARKIVAEQLAYSRELVKKSHNSQNLYDPYWQNELLFVPVAIKRNGTTHYRIVRMTNEQLQSIYNTIYNTDAFRSIYTNLPKTISDLYPDEVNSLADGNKLYEVLLNEVNEIGFDAWYSLHAPAGVDDYEYYYKTETLNHPVITRLTCRFHEGLQWYYITVPLDVSVLPKTSQEYLKQNAESYDDVEVLQDALSAVKEFDENDYLNIQFFNFGGDVPFGTVSLSSDLQDHATDVSAWVASLGADQPDIAKPFYRIQWQNSTKVLEDGGKEYWYDYKEYLSYVQGDVLPAWLVALATESANSQTAYLD